ncbi:MAG: hypothetical protein GY743_02470, partial [Planctomycetaceae bacterium]|nr:hypothetical protein [Planctomycetaceae bacterium]
MAEIGQQVVDDNAVIVAINTVSPFDPKSVFRLLRQVFDAGVMEFMGRRYRFNQIGIV